MSRVKSIGFSLEDFSYSIRGTEYPFIFLLGRLRALNIYELINILFNRHTISKTYGDAPTKRLGVGRDFGPTFFCIAEDFIKGAVLISVHNYPTFSYTETHLMGGTMKDLWTLTCKHKGNLGKNLEILETFY